MSDLPGSHLPDNINNKLREAACSQSLDTALGLTWFPAFLRLRHRAGVLRGLTLMLEATTVGSSHTDSMKNTWEEERQKR